jgi:sulfatase modifying factor 1
MKFIKIHSKDFEMMDAPVTQSEWFKVMKTKPFNFKKKPNNPAETVSWDDCQEFIKKLNESQSKYTYRLPTEQEWEYCAKPCDEQKVEDSAWCWENSKSSTQPVKKKKPNKYGLCDMLGNVWEWTDSKYSEECSRRIFRGGSWYVDAQVLRSAGRGSFSPGYRGYDLGFRLVRTVSLGPLTVLPSDSRSDLALKVARNALKEIEDIMKGKK